MQFDVKVNKIYNDLTIKELLKEYRVGKGKIEELRTKHAVKLNGEVVALETKVEENDILTFNVEESLNYLPSSRSVDVVYEDENVLIVNKPSGILIHPDGNENDTLVNRVAKYYSDRGINIEVRHAHRIDLETSGLVLFCKDFLTHARLNYEIEEHILLREYRALVTGNVIKNNGKINAPIGRDRHINNKFRVSNSEKSKSATTNYQVIKRYIDKTLIRCVLETGRTHQIRVHLSSINHPLLGDTLYGGNKKEIGRVALHSYRIKFVNPVTFKEIDICKEMPLDMRKASEK